MTAASAPATGPPIAIGGLGGSGTRVVAAILMEAGVFMGRVLNPALDNLLYARLLKDVGLLATPDNEAIGRRLAAFLEIMNGDASVAGRLRALALARQNATERPRFRRDARIVFVEGPPEGLRRWGWKEPNTHLIAERLLREQETLRYVHVVRHGLDMAYSENREQLRNFGPLFGIDGEADDPRETQRRQLRLWSMTTRAALELASRYPDRCILLRLDQLARNPGQVIPPLLDHVGLRVGGHVLERLVGIPQVPSTSGRHRGRLSGHLEWEDVELVRAIGFHVDP